MPGNRRIAALAALCLTCPAPLLAGEPPPGDRQLGEVRVSGETARGAMRPFLRDETAPVESCLIEEIAKTGAANLNEALDRRPGVAVQVECSICNARFISLNNLPGRYTTLLLDGVPLFSAVSQAYGLDSVGLRGLERIDVMRGAGAAQLFPESLAGAVNLVLRQPAGDEAEIESAAGQFGQRRLDAHAARVFDGGALIANIHRNRHASVDGDGNGVSEYTGYRRELAGLSLFGDDVGGFRLRGRLDGIGEKRGGGASGDDYEAIKASRAGNPFDFSRGAHASPDAAGWIVPDAASAREGDVSLPGGRILRPYAAGMLPAGRAGLSEIIFTDRWSAQLSGERRIGASLLRLAAGYARHDQDSFYEGNIYQAVQNQAYLGARLKLPLGGGVWTWLADWRHEDLRSTAALPDGTRADGLDNYTFRTPGLGMQADYAFLDGRLESSANLRVDRHNVFGARLSPRLNLLWNHSEHAKSRLYAGISHRAPTSYFEQDHGILETIIVRREADKMERADNFGYAFNIEDGPFKALANLHRTRLDHLARLDTGASDALGNPLSILRNADQTVTVEGADLQIGLQLNPAWSGSAALELTRFGFSPGDLAFARPGQRGYFTLAYDGGALDAFLRATWTGAQDLAKFYYREGQRYNLDGSPKPARSPAFWVIDARGEYRLDKHLALFAGVDNLGGFRQSDHDGMLWVDAAGNLDVTHIWGPNRGRFVYGGLRVAL